MLNIQRYPECVYSYFVPKFSKSIYVSNIFYSVSLFLLSLCMYTYRNVTSGRHSVRISGISFVTYFMEVRYKKSNVECYKRLTNLGWLTQPYIPINPLTSKGTGI